MPPHAFDQLQRDFYFCIVHQTDYQRPTRKGPGPLLTADPGQDHGGSVSWSLLYQRDRRPNKSCFSGPDTQLCSSPLWGARLSNFSLFLNTRTFFVNSHPNCAVQQITACSTQLFEVLILPKPSQMELFPAQVTKHLWAMMSWLYQEKAFGFLILLGCTEGRSLWAVLDLSRQPEPPHSSRQDRKTQKKSRV